MTRSRLQLAPIVIALVCGAQLAAAQGTWRFIGRSLSAQEGELTSIQDGVLAFTDREGRARELPVADLFAAAHLLPPPERPPRELPWITRQLERFAPEGIPGTASESGGRSAAGFVGRLELVDGQVWRGELLSASGESLTWLVEDAAAMSAPLERISAAALLAPLDEARATWNGLDDRVVLANGDVIDGFVAALGPELVVETGGDPASLQLDLVAGVLLANPAAEISRTLVRTAGGSVIAAEAVEVSLTGGVLARLSTKTAGPVAEFDTADLRAIVFAPDAAASLASIEPAEVVAPGASWSRDAVATVPDEQLGLDHLQLRGPVRVRWSLPRPAARLAAAAVLPPAMWAWGDCEVVVRTGDGREAFRARLSSETPRAELNVPLAGLRELTIEVEPGASGPVQDMIVLEQPIVAWR